MATLGPPTKKNKIIGVLIFSAVLLAIMALIPYSVGLSKGGFSIEGIRNQYYIYLQSGMAGLGILLLIYFVEKWLRKGDIIYGDGLGFDSPGEIPHLKTDLFNNRFRLALACVILACILGVWANATQQTFTGVGTLQEQFTKFDNAVFAGSLVAASENLDAAAVLALVIFGLRWQARKVKMSQANFQLLSWSIGILAFGLYGLINHISRYGNQDVALYTVFVFWTLGGFLTMMSGSFIPFWIVHIVNNVFYDLGKALTAEVTYYYIIAFIVGASILFTYLYFIRKQKKGEG